MTIDEILRHFDGVKGGHGQYKAKCPAHMDADPSLSIGLGRDGRLIWERDPEEFPAALSGTPAITGGECQLLPMEDVKRDVPEAAG